ncbi:hypothetical protein [secondary endosymbiont of Ctenarytaina eucalypti]|uniref:hypothetical protein n=1 Tax=secondary endosymbiont of Ctenarytaina eucalypti TaxID=1199245 RepID=UPI0002E6AA75|nr:hypothetical protein [secondary endosymbiont of Ctenarytaina eucalypti]
MLKQISCIFRQLNYYLHRATVRSEHGVLSRELHFVPRYCSIDCALCLAKFINVK